MGMSPTPRAERLARPVRRALDELQLALEPDVFSPATAERNFVVALNNFGAIALAAPIVSECLKQAPAGHPLVRYDQAARSILLNFLERGELDLKAGSPRSTRRPIASQPEPWSSITMSSSCGAATPAAKLPLWTSRALPSLPRLVISSSGEDVGFHRRRVGRCHGLSGPAALEAPICRQVR